MKNKKKLSVFNKIEFFFSHLYLSYYVRISLLSIVSCISLVLCYIFITSSFVYKEKELDNYNEIENISYSVNIDDNNFYNTNTLDENMIYLSELIDSVDVKFNYLFSTSVPVDYDVSYKAVGKLVISDYDSDKIYFSEVYDLSDVNVVTLNNYKDMQLEETVNVNYRYYNDFVNEFNKKYGIKSKSKLEVYLDLDRKINSLDLIDVESKTITFPLSDKAIVIDVSDVNNKSEIVKKDNYVLTNVLYLILALIFLIIATISIMKVINYLVLVFFKSDRYDKFINKLLKKYDEQIVETESIPDYSKLNVYKIRDFEELIDVRKNINQPIMYYNVSSHNKCYFYIKNDDDFYLCIMKAIDFDK